MKRFWRGTAALAVLAIFSVLPAKAQSLMDPEQWIVKGGFSLPTDGDVDEVGDSWLAGGLEYVIGSSDAKEVNSLEVLYTAKSGEAMGFGVEPVTERYQLISLMFNRKYRQVGPGGLALGNVLYYGAGVGAQLVNVEIEDPNPGGLGSVDKSRTLAGANVFIGYEFAANVQAEAKYQFVFGDVEDRSLNMLQLLVGIKF